MTALKIVTFQHQIQYKQIVLSPSIVFLSHDEVLYEYDFALHHKLYKRHYILLKSQTFPLAEMPRKINAKISNNTTFIFLSINIRLQKY